MTMIDAGAVAEDNALLQIVKTARVNGKDYLQIEQMYDIPAPRAEAMMKAYYANKVASIDPNEYRMLQLDRLEGLIDVMQQMAQLGNIKSGEALLKLFEQINELLGLNLQATKTEIRVITEQQSSTVYEMVRFMFKEMLATYITPLITSEHDLAVIEDGYDQKTSDLFQQAYEVIVLPQVVES